MNNSKVLIKLRVRCVSGQTDMHEIMIDNENDYQKMLEIVNDYTSKRMIKLNEIRYNPSNIEKITVVEIEELEDE